jgi:hypothetical protein
MLGLKNNFRLNGLINKGVAQILPYPFKAIGGSYSISFS